MTSQAVLIQQPPKFCQYSAGPCNQSFDSVPRTDALFLYPSEPEFVAKTIEEGIRTIRTSRPDLQVQSWTDMHTTGQLIFCRVCQTLRFARVAVADVSTLNFNVLFELGYALGLGLPVIPIRDTTLIRDIKEFDELGLLDTFGYIDFQNSAELAQQLPDAIANARAAFVQNTALNQDQPLYGVKSPVASDGLIKLMSGVKKSGLRFRSFDPKETSRLSLHDACRQVQSSLGVIAHLMFPQRRGAPAH